MSTRIMCLVITQFIYSCNIKYMTKQNLYKQPNAFGKFTLADDTFFGAKSIMDCKHIN